MTALTTRVTKDRHGWDATTQAEIAPGRFLQVQTYKRHNGRLTSTATVLHSDGGMLTHVMALSNFGAGASDYRDDVIATPMPRVTRANVENQHSRALAQWPDIVKAATAFYADRDAAKAAAAQPNEAAA